MANRASIPSLPTSALPHCLPNGTAHPAPLLAHSTPSLGKRRRAHAQGYSLSEFDRASEGELSSLNRKLSEAEEADMAARFRADLLYNLGVVSNVG